MPMGFSPGMMSPMRGAPSMSGGASGGGSSMGDWMGPLMLGTMLAGSMGNRKKKGGGGDPTSSMLPMLMMMGMMGDGGGLGSGGGLLGRLKSRPGQSPVPQPTNPYAGYSSMGVGGNPMPDF